MRYHLSVTTSSPAPPPDAESVLARVIDYSTLYESWSRRLWDLGAVLSLRELHESCAWVEEGALHQRAVDWQKTRLQPLLGPDRALGNGLLRRELTELLRGDLHAPSPRVRRLADLIETIDAGYLDRHAAALDAGSAMRVERLARTLTSHLLDSGFSMPFVHHWAHSHLGKGMPVSDLLRSAQTDLNRGMQQYEVLLPCLKIPQRQTLTEGVFSYRPRRQAVAWLEEHQHPLPTFTVDGAFCFTVEARDPYSAADQARELAERLMARDAFGAQPKHLELADVLYVECIPSALPLQRNSRFSRVPSLLREAQMYTVTAERGRLDAALELAAPLNHGSIAAAASGAWSAAESLLFNAADQTGGGERGRVVVATRLAELVACSWPRAELTALSYRLDPNSDPALDARLEQAGTNQERAAVLEQALRDGTAATPAQSPRTASDTRALQRMTQLVANPAPLLTEIALICETSFRRLYRSRNVTAHAGATSALAHAATLRVSAPLLGAALDRMAHAYLVRRVDPLVLAAQAHNSLLLVGDPLGRPLTELLE